MLGRGGVPLGRTNVRKMFYVQAVNEDGEDFSLHVVATHVDAAFDAWRAHYDLEEFGNDIRVYPLPDVGTVLGALGWETLTAVVYAGIMQKADH